MRFLERLRHHVAKGEVEVFPVVLRTLLGKHGHDRPHRVLPHGPLVSEPSLEGVEFRDARPLAHAKLNAPVADQVEHGNALGHTRRVVGRQLDDAVPEANVLRSLTGGGEKHLGRRGMGVLLKEVMLHFPRVVVAEPIGQLYLVQRILNEPILAILGPWPRKL